MRSHARSSLLALLTGVLLLLAVPVGAQAAPGIASFFAANCKVEHLQKAGDPRRRTRTGRKPKASPRRAGTPTSGSPTSRSTRRRSRAETVRAGRHREPRHAPTSPPAWRRARRPCRSAPSKNTVKKSRPASSRAPTCKASTELGENKVVVAVFDPETATSSRTCRWKARSTTSNRPKASPRTTAWRSNCRKQSPGFKGLYAHTLIEGSVEWGAEAEGTGKADYHDYFEINVSPQLPLISSRLVFKGNIGTGGFLTNPTICNGVGPTRRPG